VYIIREADAQILVWKTYHSEICVMSMDGSCIYITLAIAIKIAPSGFKYGVPLRVTHQ
jgi:hypothetical protein